MHRTHLNHVLRDAAVANAIRPIIARNQLTFAETQDLLISLNLPRAATIAAIVCPNQAG